MIGAPPSPPINAGYIIDTYDLVFGDKLILASVSLPPAIIKFPSHTRVSLRRKKVMSSTNVNGREGSIKEISGIGDWEIDIEAEFVAVEYDLSPLSLLSKMKQVLGENPGFSKLFRGRPFLPNPSHSPPSRSILSGASIPRR